MSASETSTVIYGSRQSVPVAQLVPECDATVRLGMRMSKPGPVGTTEQVGRSSARTPELNAGMETAGTRKERELC